MAGLPIFRSQVSAIRIQARVIRFRFGAGINRFSPLSTIQSSVHFGWPVAAPGGRWQAFPFGPPFSPQRSPPFSPPDRFSPLSSVIDSAIYSFRVAGGRLFHSALHSAIHSFLHSALRDRFSPLSSIQSSVHFGWPVAALGGGWRAFYSALHSVLNAVLRAVFSHPRSARSADPTPRQALPRYSILQTRYSQGPDPTRSTSTPAPPTTPCLARRIR